MTRMPPDPPPGAEGLTDEAPMPRFRMSDMHDLMATIDARAWATEFCRVVGARIPALRGEEDWMWTWFAGATSAGYFAAMRRIKGEDHDECRP